MEAEARILRRYKGDDDRRLRALVQKVAEAKASHPFSQGSEIFLVAPQPRGRTAFCLKDAQRLKDCGHDVHRRRETPSPVRLEAVPLIVEIKAERRRHTFCKLDGVLL